MIFCKRSHVEQILKGKSIALIGSGPGVLDNEPGFIDSHEVVVRVNNYKLSENAGFRTDVFYSFFGTSIRKTVKELQKDGVYLCLCKCPNSQPLESEWHRKNNKMLGVDYRYIYRNRADWWFCPTYVPTDEEFLNHFSICQNHQPTTGFDALLTILECKPKSVYMTGFDFFQSGIHNVNEKWAHKNNDDPIRHMPGIELNYIKSIIKVQPISMDKTLQRIIQ